MMTTEELQRRASSAMTLSAHDAAAQRQVILAAIADETIAELVRRYDDTIAWYRQGGADFVFVEEGVSVRLECLSRVLRDDDEWTQAHAAGMRSSVRLVVRAVPSGTTDMVPRTHESTRIRGRARTCHE